MSQDRILAIVVLLFAGLLLSLWIPLDSSGVLIEQLRGRSQIGDGLAPGIAGVLLLVSGGWLLVKPSDGARLRLANLKWILLLVGLLAAALALMVWTGPALAWLLDQGPYRALRASPPWTYLGFVAGGLLLIAGSIGLVEGRLTPRQFLFALLVPLSLALLIDLSFDDLLLPPNGDL